MTRPTVNIRSGSVYLSASVHQAYFSSAEAVIILIRDHNLQILPVHSAAVGGCFLKIVNAAGDRVASAPDAFFDNDLQDLQADALPATWSEDMGALIVALPRPKIAN